MNNKERYEAGIIDTTDGNPPTSFDPGAPGPIKENGQHSQYWVLSESERSKGFIRPVRNSYKHVGIAGPKYPIRPLNEEELDNGLGESFQYFEEYPEGSVRGKYWTQEQIDSVDRGCGTVTTMGRSLAETYAANPQFYGSTMCCGCGVHLPVGETGEFIWNDGSGERVGS